ncbi:hypothetical protein ASG82_11790 [Mycobacterium sp. Soil538]|nr:hypothetical protein ASG82_11790 [Mycobacterium sp. Soil538]
MSPALSAGDAAIGWSACFTIPSIAQPSRRFGAIGQQVTHCAGFMVCCFPVKVDVASAGWTRAVAIIDA